mgnify:CR=1 FL=1
MNIRHLFILAFCMISLGSSAQHLGFVRVYDTSGKKTGKGVVSSVTESSLKLERRGRMTEFAVADIAKIKTKRSDGNNVAIGATPGATTMAILGIATAEEGDWFGYNEAEGALAGALFGIPLGSAVGGLTILLKNSKTFVIEGDAAKLKEFEAFLVSNKK